MSMTNDAMNILSAELEKGQPRGWVFGLSAGDAVGDDGDKTADGPEVKGEVVSVEVAQSAYTDAQGRQKHYPIVVVDVPGDGLRVIRGWQTALNDLAGVRAGDLLAVKYEGKGQKKAGRKPAALFTVVCLRRDDQGEYRRIVLPRFDPTAPYSANLAKFEAQVGGDKPAFENDPFAEF